MGSPGCSACVCEIDQNDAKWKVNGFEEPQEMGMGAAQKRANKETEQMTWDVDRIVATADLGSD